MNLHQVWITVNGTIEIIITHDEKLLELLNPVVIEFTEEFKIGEAPEKGEKEDVNNN